MFSFVFVLMMKTKKKIQPPTMINVCKLRFEDTINKNVNELKELFCVFINKMSKVGKKLGCLSFLIFV
jgi:hypothetical protein